MKKTNIISTVNVGWDYRPNLPSNFYKNLPLFEQPTYNELKNHVLNGINWVEKRKLKVPAQSLYIYSWAEFPEGGWLTPTLNENDLRLRAVAEARGIEYENPFVENPNLKKDFDLGGDVDSDDAKLLVSKFKTSNLEYDLNNDDKINILDLVVLGKKI